MEIDATDGFLLLVRIHTVFLQTTQGIRKIVVIPLKAL